MHGTAAGILRRAPMIPRCREHGVCSITFSKQRDTCSHEKWSYTICHAAAAILSRAAPSPSNSRHCSAKVSGVSAIRMSSGGMRHQPLRADRRAHHRDLCRLRLVNLQTRAAADAQAHGRHRAAPQVRTNVGRVPVISIRESSAPSRVIFGPGIRPTTASVVSRQRLRIGSTSRANHRTRAALETGGGAEPRLP
jgi:hypothetical protein